MSALFKLDLINWLDGVLAEMRYGTHTFIVHYRSGWTGYEVECLLRKYGILVYGRMYNELSPDEDHYGFRVARHQAGWAEYLMFRAGVPIVSPTFDPRNEKVRAKTNQHSSLPPGGWGRKANGFGRIMDWLAVFASVPVDSHNHDLRVEKRPRPAPAQRGTHNGRYRRGKKQSLWEKYLL